VQFHPSYSYEEFVEGLRPQTKNGGIAFEPHKGVLLRLCAGLTSDGDYRVLVVDEMDRANLPKVLGELLYMLEYRDKPIDLQYSLGFRLPKKLLLIGTMNTADRSIRSIDVALRRRFDVFECPPNAAILQRYYASRVNDVADLVAGFEALNAALRERLDRHHAIGHAFLMADPMTPQRLRHIWRHKIGPLIEEYFFDQPDVASEFDGVRFWPSLANATD
jgi:5-methylcytosine-specific restriction endonuclease McrBC GTP-binding regulatory subunit McrB